MKYMKMAVLAVALLALAAGSAQAQECVAGATYEKRPRRGRGRDGGRHHPALPWSEAGH